ncbi:MAG: hypothetical protein J7621_28215 [Niastella sp.]|nr:hypothetical protein [Niastella sp.]
MRLQLKYLFISLGIMIAWMAIAFLLTYPSRGKLGATFGVSVLYILARQVCLFVGLSFLLLRLIGLLKPYNFGYILSGTLNAGTGITAVILYFFALNSFQLLNAFLYNLLLGVIMLVDSFRIKLKEPSSK